MDNSKSSIFEAPERWTVIDENNEIIIRINESYKDHTGTLELPMKMGIAIPLKEHNTRSKEVTYALEDMLDNILFKNKIGINVATVTGLGEKKFVEFLSYTRDDLNFGKVHQHFIDTFKDFEIQMYAERDETWEAYKAFTRSLI